MVRVPLIKNCIRREIILIDANFNPLCSKRETISPTNPRWTPSGFTNTTVCSIDNLMTSEETNFFADAASKKLVPLGSMTKSVLKKKFSSSSFLNNYNFNKLSSFCPSGKLPMRAKFSVSSLKNSFPTASKSSFVTFSICVITSSGFSIFSSNNS